MCARARRGQALVELAMLLPLLVLLFCAVLHFGILFYLQIMLEEGVREASLWASYNPSSDAKILQVVRSSLPSFVNQNDLFPEVTSLNPDGTAPGSRSVGDMLRISIRYEIQLLKDLPFGALLPIPTRVNSMVTIPIVDDGV
jgi:Flp pilus assembly protein TadG